MTRVMSGPALAEQERLADLRDMFAAHALQSLMLDKAVSEGAEPEDLAELAYEQADAMLRERAKGAT
ncbi:MAG TPA: hypothetical protein VJN18_35700 [Polyangiaceae bacterium]|nr:hypothetical protein [Polyangiaceae bacterium]